MSNAPPSTSPQHPYHPPTSLTFTFLPDYRLDLSIRSLLGSRARLTDVPKIAQLIEDRIHAWFDERVVEPRFQQIVLPSLWPRKRTARGPDGDESAVDGSEDEAGNGAETADGGMRYAPDDESLEAKMEREGQKLRDALKRGAARDGLGQAAAVQSQSEMAPGSGDGMRRRLHERDHSLENLRNMPGAMPI